ncbi:MAG: anti-sigma factor [Gammaproteobacteria bacterium]
MNSRYNLESLNAYVDGELSARENAEVANAIATDPELARQAASLSSLRATLASTSCGRREPIDIELPRKKRLQLPWVAAIAGLIITAALLSAFILNKAALLPNQGLQLAEEAHKSWLEEESAPEDPGLNKASVLDLDRLQIDAYVPDLSEVNLRFSGVRKISSGKSRGMHIGYRGPSGCMVSLVVLNNTAGLSKELAYFERRGHLLYGWQVKQTGFYLLAYKMDPVRLAKVARVVNKLTRERLPLDPESIVALNEARSESKPCLT